jgi:hypothetical protein
MRCIGQEVEIADRQAISAVDATKSMVSCTSKFEEAVFEVAVETI